MVTATLLYVNFALPFARNLPKRVVDSDLMNAQSPLFPPLLQPTVCFSGLVGTSHMDAAPLRYLH